MSESARRREFESLYAENYHRLLGYALRRTTTADDADDVVAGTFLAAWRRFDELPPGEEARLWLYGAARKVLANHQRGERRRTRLTDRLRTDVSQSVTLPGGSGDGVESEVVRAALSGLRPEEREILTLVAWEGLDRGELAAVLGCTRNAVRIRLHRARKRFASALERPQADQQPQGVVGHLKVQARHVPASAGEELR